LGLKRKGGEFDQLQPTPRIKMSGAKPPLAFVARTGKTLPLIFNISHNNMSRVKVKVKFTLEQATKAQRGSRGIAVLFL
jgi:hypothetical protein